MVAAQQAPPNDLPFEPEDEERWVLVDTEAYRMTVFEGERPFAHFENPAVGRYGTAETRRRGDRTTPLGKFRINRINEQSEYHLFLGLDYPSLENARKARDAGTINQEEYLEFLDDFARLGRPPQGTALGGHIGIHGVGDGDVQFHRNVNWTDGCVALEDDQIEALASLVGIGTRVYIR
nr:L,D-transpeptidase [Halorhodospira halophila]